MSDIIEGIKLIRHNASGVNELDDLSYPFLLQVSLSPPEFMMMAFIGTHGGGEEILVRGMTEDVLEEFVERNNLRRHPRLQRLKIIETSEAYA
ncbi:MAG: hypothetical protein GY797_38015 [Deltaproteobacteria bacterium]|nr:hypothetical protein [Deltaproteobacteria bacterium]